MKKYSLILIALFSITMTSYAQNRYSARKLQNKSIATSRGRNQYLGVGLRGGVAVPFSFSNQVPLTIGIDGKVDIHYQMLWHERNLKYGFATGVTLGLQQIQLKQSAYSDYYATTSDGCAIEYDIRAKGIVEKQQQIAAEIPIMFALRTKDGFFFNIGPSFALPLLKQSTVSFESASIDAYYPDEDVTVYDEVITGKTGAQTNTKAAWNAPLLTIKAGFQLGYSFVFKKHGALDLGVYCDCSCMSIYAKKDESPMVQVIPPSEAVQPAQVTINSLSNRLPNLMAGAVGIKLMYQIPLDKNK